MCHLWKMDSCRAVRHSLPKEVANELPTRSTEARVRPPSDEAAQLRAHPCACTGETERSAARRDPAPAAPFHTALTFCHSDRTSFARRPWIGTETHRSAIVSTDSVLLPSGAGQADGHGFGELFDARPAGPRQ